MGWGDEIMVTAQARAMQAADPRPVRVLDRKGNARVHEIWRGNPRITSDDQVDAQVLVNGSGARPYVDYEAMGGNAKDRTIPWRYSTWSVNDVGPGELMIQPMLPGGYLVIEPHVKDQASPNKRWPWEYAGRLVELLDADWVQVGPPGTRILAGARHVPTASFLDGCRVLSGAAGAVLPEGGLHHAAAALGIPAVVIFGGMTSPANTGYDAHVNLAFEGAADPCGSRELCRHCDQAMRGITPEFVAEQVQHIQRGNDA